MASFYSVQSLKEEGSWAKWGGITKSGEIFNDDLFTCASNRFPIGSLIRVYSPRTHKAVIVRVNDTMAKRYTDRIDLSKSAFICLSDDLKRGIEEVTTERVK